MINAKSISKIIRGLVMVLATSMATAAWAQPAAPEVTNSIEAINVANQQGGNIVVRITLKQPLANPPAGFAINNPPRIAFDFPGIANALGKNSQEVGDGDLRNMNIVQAGNRTRLVMNLNKPLGYDTRIDGKNVIITLQGTATAAANAPPATSHFSEAKPADARHSLRDVSFRRGANGEGRIIVDLSDNTVGIDLRQQGKTLIIDFQNTSLPKNLERRLDVVDFATPVQTIEAFVQGGNSRITIEPKGLWEHSAYQTDNRFIVEVKPLIEDQTKLIQGSRLGYSGDKLSLNFQNVEVRAVLQVIADFTGFNFITSDTVTGNLTLRLKDVPWDQALDIILQTKGLDMRKNGNVVLIAPRDEIATKEKLALESQAQIADLEPVHTESFTLNYQQAAAFQKLLADKDQRILSKRGSAVVDTRTNTVFVQDTPSRLDQVRALMKKIDVPVRQVLIEARIVEASDTFSRNLGARLGINNTTASDTVGSKGNLRIATGATLEATTASQFAGTPTLARATNVNLPVSGLGGSNPGAFSIILFNEALSRFLNMEVQALQVDGKGKIISSPRVITADKVEATIEQGTQIPYQQATSSGATSVSFKSATLSLKVKPQITPDDNVIMNLNIHKDSVGATTTAGPAIDTKQITTEVLVENGGTVVIGGIYTQTETDNTTKIPVLGDVPYIGFLFRNNAKVDDRNELLVFISPRIIKNSMTLR